VALSRAFVDDLRSALGAEHVITEPEQLRVYECDGLTGHRAVPELVVLPGSTEDVQTVLRASHSSRAAPERASREVRRRRPEASSSRSRG
jgi:glycolate oxidase